MSAFNCVTCELEVTITTILRRLLSTPRCSTMDRINHRTHAAGGPLFKHSLGPLRPCALDFSGGFSLSQTLAKPVSSLRIRNQLKEMSIVHKTEANSTQRSTYHSLYCSFHHARTEGIVRGRHRAG